MLSQLYRVYNCHKPITNCYIIRLLSAVCLYNIEYRMEKAFIMIFFCTCLHFTKGPLKKRIVLQFTDLFLLTKCFGLFLNICKNGLLLFHLQFTILYLT